MSPRAEEGLLACLLRLPRLLPGEQRVSLGHEAGDARLWVRWEVRVYEVWRMALWGRSRGWGSAWVRWEVIGLTLGLVWGEGWGGGLMTP